LKIYILNNAEKKETRVAEYVINNFELSKFIEYSYR